MTDAPAADTAPALSDFSPFLVFAAEFERQKLGSVHTLRWLVRFRTENGLLKSGAVVELRSPGATRPRLLVNRPRFTSWLASQSTDAQAA